MNKRNDIKNRIVSLLIAANTAAGSRVYSGRYIPLDRPDLPAIVVYIQKESAVMNDTVYQKRTAKAVIECIVDSETPDSGIDILTDQVEIAIMQDESLGGTIHTAALTDIEMAVDEDSGSHIEGARMMFDCTYFVEAVANTPSDKFEKAEVEYNGGDFSDSVTLPT